MASVCSAVLYVAHSSVTWSVIHCVLKQGVIPKVTMRQKRHEATALPKFVAIITLPVSSCLSSSLLRLCLSFTTYALLYFTEVTRHFHGRPLHREGQALGLPLMNHRVLHTQSITSLNANQALHILQHSQHDKIIATFL